MNGQKRSKLALRCAIGIIRLACLMLPEAARAEREVEWCVELEEIAFEQDVRWRALRALHYALSLLPTVRDTLGVAEARAQRDALYRSFRYGFVALDQVLTDGFRQGRFMSRFLGAAAAFLGISGLVSLIVGSVSLARVGLEPSGLVGVFLGVLSLFLGGGAAIAIVQRLKGILRSEDRVRDASSL
ncbi:hypothetical protein ABZX38_32100 [Streptomyces longwoodensis]|uniref:hypothetical protein n=1 Tax=Streptomyces longwoodensis TaxID=68231 RepID=UPI0033B23033